MWSHHIWIDKLFTIEMDAFSFFLSLSFFSWFTLVLFNNLIEKKNKAQVLYL